MSKKQEHQFPENWKNISSEEAIKHIKYLLEHYQEYDMCKFGDNGIVINGIYFYPVVINLRHGVTFKYMYINMQKVYGRTEDIYPMIQQLIKVCKVEIEKREQEKAITAAKNAKKQKVKNIVLGSISGALLVAIFVATGYMIDVISKTIDKERARQNKIEKEVKKYEKTLPHYNEYLQTQKQIQNYRDSIERIYR
ncbi:MAG: hypothetical protein ACLRFQ_04340 [Alphaproteobacteria bacterium]